MIRVPDMENRCFGKPHRRRGCTSTARSQRNSRCRCVTGFLRGCAAVYIAVFPLALRRARSPVPPPVLAIYTAGAQDLKELPSADPYGLPLVLRLSLLFHISYLKTLQSVVISSLTARSELINFFLHPGGVVQNTIMLVCVFL